MTRNVLAGDMRAKCSGDGWDRTDVKLAIEIRLSGAGEQAFGSGEAGLSREC